jgi:hypothetical protein
VETTVDLVHLAILKDAADIANRKIAEAGVVGTRAQPRAGQRFDAEARKKRRPQGQVFRPDPIQSHRGGLCLSLDPMITEKLDYVSLLQLHEIGRNAIREAIMLNRNAFAGLIVGETRAGRNYFDRFHATGDQMTIF